MEEGPPARLGQEEFQRLLERVAAVLPREVQGLPDPTHQALLVFWATPILALARS